LTGTLVSFLWEDHIIANDSECWRDPVFFKYTENKHKKIINCAEFVFFLWLLSSYYWR